MTGAVSCHINTTYTTLHYTTARAYSPVAQPAPDEMRKKTDRQVGRRFIVVAPPGGNASEEREREMVSAGLWEGGRERDHLSSTLLRDVHSMSKSRV